MSVKSESALKSERERLVERLQRLTAKKCEEIGNQVFSVTTIREIQATERGIDFIDEQLAFIGGGDAA